MATPSATVQALETFMNGEPLTDSMHLNIPFD
jgi:hypothetical protein